MTVSGSVEFTVDELAREAGMTVRNVRAYASRGIIDPPRLEGRTGYYSMSHLNRLRLVRSLLERGFTLAAVEQAIVNSPNPAPEIALDLISMFDASAPEIEPQVISREEIELLAGTSVNEDALAELEQLGLIELDGDRIVLLAPDVVRPGIAALGLGLTEPTLLKIAAREQEVLRSLAQEIVSLVSAEIAQPFIDAGLPESERERVLSAIEGMIPIAGQSVLGMFRTELQHAVEQELVTKLSDFNDE